MKAIKTENLTKYYGKTLGIKNLNLEVEKGDFFGFIGPNGSGKSTTIRTLLGLITPTSGAAEVLGLDIIKDKTEILKRVGYMPGEAFFYSKMKVRDILKLSASLRGLNCQSEAAALCERLDLDQNKTVDSLSLGNRKKVSIVCAMQHRPDLYILDEPTSGLDPLMQKEFYTLLEERNREGATVFLSSHVLSEIDRYCKNAAIIRGGEILVADSIGALSKTGGKRVVLKGVSTLPENDLVFNIKAENDSVSFLYGGAPLDLLTLVSKIPFTDINISDPELDEIFLHYYKKEEN